MIDILHLLAEIKLLLRLSKEVFTLDEFAAYAGISKHTAYKYTSERQLPYYRVGKLIYMKKQDVIDFLLRNRIASSSESESNAYARLINTE